MNHGWVGPGALVLLWLAGTHAPVCVCVCVCVCVRARARTRMLVEAAADSRTFC